MDVRVERIFAAAQERARKDHLPYFGALSPIDAYAVIKAVPNGRLIDVRTRPEWDYVGHVPESSLLEGNAYPDGRRNPQFLPELRVKAPDPEAPVLFLCRSGHRSDGAAPLGAAGGGFEGVQRSRRIRGRQGCARAARHAGRLAQGRPAVGSGIEQIHLVAGLRRRTGIDKEFDLQFRVAGDADLRIGGAADVFARRKGTPLPRLILRVAQRQLDVGVR